MTDPDPVDDADLIWHYTNGHGLLGILDREKPHIYATDALYLNDTRELAIALAHQVEGLKQDFPDDDLVGEHSVRRLYKLALGQALDHVSPAEGVYVASFCKNGDLLSQWRGYGTAAGYALAVSRPALTALMEGNGDRVVDVLYGSPDEEFLEVLRPASVQFGKQITLRSDVAAIAALKDSSFSEEAEVRLVAQAGSREVHYRSGPRGLIPFLKVDLPLTCVRAIRLGPGLSTESAIRAIERLGAERGIHDLKVCTSKVPYRG